MTEMEMWDHIVVVATIGGATQALSEGSAAVAGRAADIADEVMKERAKRMELDPTERRVQFGW